MTKGELCARIGRDPDCGVTKDRVQAIVNEFIAIMQDAIVAKKTVYLRGFGTFRPMKVLRRFSTGRVLVRPYIYPSSMFKPSKALYKKIDPGFDSFGYYKE